MDVALQGSRLVDVALQGGRLVDVALQESPCGCRSTGESLCGCLSTGESPCGCCSSGVSLSRVLRDYRRDDSKCPRLPQLLLVVLPRLQPQLTPPQRRRLKTSSE